MIKSQLFCKMKIKNKRDNFNREPKNLPNSKRKKMMIFKSIWKIEQDNSSNFYIKKRNKDYKECKTNYINKRQILYI